MTTADASYSSKQASSCLVKHAEEVKIYLPLVLAAYEVQWIHHHSFHMMVFMSLTQFLRLVS